MREKLRLIDWKSVLKGSVDNCWTEFKKILLELRNMYVPVTKVKDKAKAPWINNKAVKWVKKKHRVFRKYKDSSHRLAKEYQR